MSTNAKPQRLALFLDGTWNTEDDSTNVRNAYHLTLEGEMPDGYIQKRYYDRGVGTGMLLDGLTGGIWGDGLETNVREAYNWLVDQYNDGDEVYIFGFSRGAYTARSLVGLIAACGLVRRGAPLTVNQLWQGYAFISQNRSQQSNDWWAKAFEKNAYYFRRINYLVKDAWKKDDKWVIRPPLSETERMLAKWSRRIQITYLGVFDTVGALGIHALGIPGLKSRLAESHNQNPTRILKSCRHALAVDENRASFRLTPILNYVRHWGGKGLTEYKDIILQRWFIGAHSNVGGGYATNSLSMRPFEWILEGATAAHLHMLPAQLICEEAKEPLQVQSVSDSYSNFAGVVWPHVLREKRNHRPIGRAPKVRTGYSLVTIDEEVDETVFELLKKSPDYAPPNLLSYIRRSGDEEKKKLIANRKVGQKWPGDHLTNDLSSRFSARLFLVFWAALTAFGLTQALQFLLVNPLPIATIGISLLAVFYVLVDWGEARATLDTALYPGAVIPRVTWNVLFWMRLLGVLFFIIGFFVFAVTTIKMAWATNLSLAGIRLFLSDFWSFIQSWLLFPLLSASATVLLLDVIGPYLPFNTYEKKAKEYADGKFDFGKKEERKENRVVLISALVVAVLGFCWSYLHWLDGDLGTGAVSDIEPLAGRFLLLLLLLAAFGFMSGWVSKPLGKSRANLGEILQLQGTFSGKQITDLFNYWGSKLKRGWVAREWREALAWLRTRQVVRIALWRDLLGFIPMYTTLFLVALSFGAAMNWCHWGGLSGATSVAGTSWWLWLVGGIALADVLENTIHLRHIKNHPQGGSSSFLVYTGVLVTWLKLVGFFTAALITLVVFVLLAYEMLQVDSGGWRWMIAIFIIYIMLIIGAGFLFQKIKERVVKLF